MVQIAVWSALSYVVSVLERLKLGPLLWLIILWVFIESQPRLSVSLFTLCAFCFLATLAALILGRKTPTSFSNQNPERWIVKSWLISSFAHLNTLHLAGNFYAIHILLNIFHGRFSEAYLASWTFSMLMQISLFRATANQIYCIRPIRSMGASGWIFAWFGYGGQMIPHMKIEIAHLFQFPIYDNIYLILGFLIALSLFDRSSGVDHGSHAWGFAVGAANGFLMKPL